MRRWAFGVTIAAALAAAALTGGALRAEAAPAPSLAAALVEDGACGFTLTAVWRNTKVDQVFGLWYLDGAFLLTTEAPATGPNGGTLMGRRATMQTGPFARTDGNHSWHVLVQFYYRGAAVGDVTTVAVDAPCAVSAGP